MQDYRYYVYSCGYDLCHHTGCSKKADTHTVSQVSAFLYHPVVNRHVETDSFRSVIYY